MSTLSSNTAMKRALEQQDLGQWRPTAVRSIPSLHTKTHVLTFVIVSCMYVLSIIIVYQVECLQFLRELCISAQLVNGGRSCRSGRYAYVYHRHLPYHRPRR